MANEHPEQPDEDVAVAEGTNGGGSPLDAEPAPRAKKSRSKRRVREYEEDVPESEAARHYAEQHPPRPDETSEFESSSPLDSMADAALLMAEVDRIGPGEGPGWVGRAYDHGDGRGPQPVSYGRAGSYPDDQGIVERVQATIGGGQVRFVRPGKKPVVMVLGGAPLPLPSEQVTQTQAWGQGFGRPDDVLPQDPGDPFGPGYDPEVGIAPEEVAQTGLNGWFQNGQTGRWLFYRNGAPANPPRSGPGSKPPIPAAGFGAFQGFSPADFDHRPREEDSKLDKLIQLMMERDSKKEDSVEALKLKIDADRLQFERERAAAELRYKQEKDAADKKWEQEKLEGQRRWDAEVAARKADAANAVEIAKAKAAAEEKIAQVNADAAKFAAEQNAKTAESNQKMFMSSVEKGDGFKMIERMAGLGLLAIGGGEKSETAEQAAMIREGFAGLKDVLATAFPHGVRDPNRKPLPADAVEKLPAEFRLLGVMLKNFERGVEPAVMPLVIVTACDSMGMEIKKTLDTLRMATPELVAAQIEKGLPAGADDATKQQFEKCKAVVLSPQGRAWFEAVRAALRGEAPAPSIAQGQPAAQQ